jgi:hypothetical protein
VHDLDEEHLVIDAEPVRGLQLAVAPLEAVPVEEPAQVEAEQVIAIFLFPDVLADEVEGYMPGGPRPVLPFAVLRSPAVDLDNGLAVLFDDPDVEVEVVEDVDAGRQALRLPLALRVLLEPLVNAHPLGAGLVLEDGGENFAAGHEKPEQILSEHVPWRQCGPKIADRNGKSLIFLSLRATEGSVAIRLEESSRVFRGISSG